MRQGFFLFALVLMCLQCRGNAPSKDNPSGKKTASSKKATPSAPETADAKDKAVPENRLLLIATVDYPKESPPAPFDVELRYSSQGRVTGSARLDKSDLALHGVIDEGRFRVWVVGNVGDASRVRRGYIIGELENGVAAGTFAISGNAGSPNFRGTVKSK